MTRATVVRETADVAGTLRLAERLAGGLRGGELIGLEGELGSGKTCFVRGLAGGLGLDAAEVSSPTFIICRIYRDHAPLCLVHVDAFRLQGPQDLDGIGWDEFVGRPDSVVAVEWPGRIAGALPADRIEIAIEHTGETSRRLTLAAPAALAACWLDG